MEPTELANDHHAVPEYLEYQRELSDNPMNFIEIRRLPKKVEPRALTSMIVGACKILPKMTEISYKEDTMERVALVEFKSDVDAFKAIDRLRMSVLGNSWRMRLICSPRYLNPSKEIVDKLSR